MATLSQDKHTSLLKKMGKFISEQRTRVFQETPAEFAIRLNRIYPLNAEAHHIDSLEQGDGNLPFSFWLTSWQLMQVADKVADASKSDIALFLATAQQLSLTEHDVLEKTPKG